MFACKSHVPTKSSNVSASRVRVCIYLQHICPSCICASVKRSGRGSAGSAPADRSGDKAAESELTTCSTVLATDVPIRPTEEKRDGISSRCGCVFLNFDVNMICHGKKCFVPVIHMVSITELIYIIWLRGTFFLLVIVSVDLRTLGSM